MSIHPPKIKGDGKYPLVHILSIELPERPEEGEESTRILFNPRSMESFDSETMTNIRESIRTTGLLQNPNVRVITKNGLKDGEIEKIELIAGERRYRSMWKLFKDNSNCFDDHANEWVEGKKLYEYIPCKVHYNISDEAALKIAFTENNEHKSLTIKEEIALVERLTRMGHKQDKISSMLGTNVTWVSQTSNFRNELPEAAFEKLLDGKISRHVAVQILSFPADDREKLYFEAVIVEEKTRRELLEALDDEIGGAEIEVGMANEEHEEAAVAGDSDAAKAAQRKAARALKRKKEAEAKTEAVEKTAGTIKQGHIAAASQKERIAPKKAKMLGRPQVQQLWVDLVKNWMDRGDSKIDVEMKKPYPIDVLEVVHLTAKSILDGEHDPAEVIRNYLLEKGIWVEKR